VRGKGARHLGGADKLVECLRHQTAGMILLRDGADETAALDGVGCLTQCRQDAFDGAGRLTSTVGTRAPI
jgi:hypothetical protein